MYAIVWSNWSSPLHRCGLGWKIRWSVKKTWISAYLSLPPEDEIVQTFTHMGNDSHATEAALKSPLQDDGNIPEMYRPMSTLSEMA